MDKRILSALLPAAGAILAALGLFLGSERGGPLPPGKAPPFEGPPPKTPFPPLPRGKRFGEETQQAQPPRKSVKGFSLQVLALSLEGREKKGEGKPLPGIQVRVLGPARGGFSEEEPPLLGRGRTDAGGSLFLQGLPPPPWVVEAFGEDRAALRRILASPPPGTSPLVLRLAPGWSLEGRIRDPHSGLPLAGIRVEALPFAGEKGGGKPLPRRTRTSREGTFLLEGLDRAFSYRLHMGGPGFEERTSPRAYRAGTPFLELSLKALSRVEATLLPPGDGTFPSRMKICLLAGSRGEKGPFFPLGFTPFLAWPPGGTLSLPCPGPGFYRVRVDTPPGGNPPFSGTSPVFQITGNEPFPPAVTVPLHRGTLLEGRVVDGRGGRPLEGVLLWVRGKWEKTKTGPEGRFRLPALVSGGGVLVLRIPGERGLFLPFRVSPGRERADLGDLVLPRSCGRIEGTLRDSSGRPLEGRTLYLGGPGLDPWNWPVETGRGGKFRQGGLPFGSWEIRHEGKALAHFRLSGNHPGLALELTLPKENP